MKNIRIGNDISFVWSFYTGIGRDRQPYDLTGKELLLTLTDKFGKETYPEFNVEGNELHFSFLGKDQSCPGAYTITAQENKGELGMKSIDKISPFTLVERQEVVLKECNSNECPAFEAVVVELASEFEKAIDYGSIVNKPKINDVELTGNKSASDLGLVEEALKDSRQYVRENGEWVEIKRKPYISLERLRPYLYKVTFDSLPNDNGGSSPVTGGCSSYVKDGKLYTNLDWEYSNTASFLVKTKDFEGQSLIDGLNDSNLNDDKIGQLPYRVHRGINNYGISVASHILYNDWAWTGTGSKTINLTRLPFIILSRVKSMTTFGQDLNGVLDNLYCPQGLADMDYLLQIIVTDGLTTYAVVPPMAEGQSYEVINITANPKLANFRWVASETVVRTELQRRPTGIERWNAMPCDLKDLRFTKAYENADRLSEFIGINGTTKYSSDAELLAIYNEARAEYLQRERDGKTWQTMESAVYGRKLESLYIQEDWSDNLVPATTELVKLIETRLSNAIEDEAIRATQAEGSLLQGIEEEAQRAVQVEVALGDAISDEEQRALTRENQLEELIETEKERAESAESELTELINSKQGEVGLSVINGILNITYNQ